MGNSESSSSDPRFISATRSFTPKYLEDLKSLFQSLAAQSHSDHQYISPSVFKKYYGLHGALGDRMFDLITQKRGDEKLTFEDLVIAKGIYEKGTRDEIEEFIYQLLDVNGDGTVERSDLEAVLKELFDYVFPNKRSEPGSATHLESIDVFIDAANLSKDDGGCAMSFEDFKRWCTLLPSVRKFLGSLLRLSDPGSQVPHLLLPENLDSKMLLLREEYAWHIGGALSHQELGEWRLLYHSAVHGLSFSTFLGKISNNEGPTVLVIKDNDGYIYGGYASQPWERHADFYGDMKSFLFQLYPKASIYRPTGANNNIQWCAMNFSSESIPNGIGFGGRANHLGLFLSANFDQGHTFPCTTFGSPCLSKTDRIIPEVIECWGIAPKGSEEETPNGLKGSVLERFKEERNMLNLVGLANSSQ